MREIAVCPGDPAGIGAEICAKAISVLQGQAEWHVFADEAAFAPWAKKFDLPETSYTLHPIARTQSFSQLLGVGQNIERQYEFGRISALGGIFAYASVKEAVEWILQKQTRRLVTGCIHKESLKMAGIPFIGHTEMVSHLSGGLPGRTMFQTGDLRIFFLSRHVSLREAIDLVKRDRIYKALGDINKDLAALGIVNPKIAVAGLNPHCGEHGLFGTEDDDEVRPGVEHARAEGIDAYGPIGADSVFHLAKIGHYDAVLSLYHDQGHIAAKTFDFDRTITLTLGLPFLRTSVDHGTAFDIAGRGVARAESMICAMRAAL